MRREGQYGPVAEVLIQRYQKSAFVDGASKDRIVRRRGQADVAYSDRIVAEGAQGARNSLVEHLVEEQTKPLHARSGSSSVCSMTE